jgi:hypothetical protein
MRTHKPYHSFIRGQLMVMLQVYNIVVPITTHFIELLLQVPFATHPRASLFNFFLHTHIVAKTFLVAKKSLYLRTLPSLPHIKPCQFCVVTIVLICVIQCIEFQPHFWHKLLRHQITLQQKGGLPLHHLIP